MFNETDYNFFTTLLLNNSIQWSQVPGRIKTSSHFQTLLSSKILKKETSGRGHLVTILDRSSFEDF